MTHSPASDHAHAHGLHHTKKKRVGKACDSCRIKKTKCDGKKPCSRCILDNKICVFTEKKKQREKSHPVGYVELLETRLDILTKSLEKLVELSTPHLGFLQQLVAEHEARKAMSPPGGGAARAKAEFDSNDELSEYDNDHSDDDSSNDDDLSADSAVPINKVVAYLINRESLLSTLPVEWERGALIAANFNRNDIGASAKLFAEHKLNVQDQDDRPAPGGGHDGAFGGMALVNTVSSNSGEFSSSRGSSINDHAISDFDSDPGAGSASRYATTTSLQRSFTDNTSVKTEPSSPPGMDGFPKRANSLFLHSSTNGSSPHISAASSRSNSSVALLTSKFENQGLSSPVESPQDVAAHGRSLVSRRASQRSSSPSAAKIKNNGHVHKRPHPSKHDSFKNGVEFMARGRRGSAISSGVSGANAAMVGSLNPGSDSYDAVTGVAVGPSSVARGGLFDSVVALSPQSSRNPESLYDSKYDDFGGSSLDDFGTTFAEVPADTFKMGQDVPSPSSLFDAGRGPFAGAAAPALAMGEVPSAGGMLEDDGFDFLSNSPYMA